MFFRFSGFGVLTLFVHMACRKNIRFLKIFRDGAVPDPDDSIVDALEMLLFFPSIFTVSSCDVSSDGSLVIIRQYNALDNAMVVNTLVVDSRKRSNL